jgi:CelD/BcsL family acetyltransferase involved in cellulose biosynthesis
VGDRYVIQVRSEPSDLRLERLSGLDAGGGDWEALAERAENLFATREWLSTWWRHFGRGELLLFGTRRRDDTLTAILPLYRSRLGPARILRFLGHGASDELGPICDPVDTPAVAQALQGALREGSLGAWDVLLAEQLLREKGWSDPLGGTVAREESSPVLRARGRSFEEVLASRSRNFRQQVRRRERRLRREHGLRYRLAEDPARLDADLTALFELHAARWGENGSTVFTPARQAFHREFARLALDKGWLRLWLAEVDGAPVAALYGFRFAGSELYYQSGRDPAWDRYAVGFVLLTHAVRAALEDGCSEYRLLRGGEPYKQRFADYDPGLATLVLARGPAMRTAVRLAVRVAEHDLPRRWLRRALG